MKDILLINAQIVNEGTTRSGDVRIRHGRIDQIASRLQARPHETVIDVEGQYLIPGMIDDQVHFREPGLTDKADIKHESRAAVAGGTTSVMDMPNTRPPALTRSALATKFARASRNCLTNYSFYMGASHGNIEDIKRIDPKEIGGVKVFMGSSTGNMLVDDPHILESIFRDSPVLIATHCEDTPTIIRNEQLYRDRFGEHVPFRYHAQIRSAEACYRSSSLAVSLARQFGANLHVLHISTEKELSLFTSGPIDQKTITAEACVHFLHFTEADYDQYGALIKCNPSIKTASDQQALLQALRDDRLDIIGSDHAPHTLIEKRNPYFRAPSGLPLVQHSLLILFDLFISGDLSLYTIVNKTSHAPARRFRIRDRGFIREGYWADLVIINPKQATIVKNQPVFSKCGWTPFFDHTFQTSIRATFVNGHPVWYNGQINDNLKGSPLKFLPRA